MVGAHHEPTPPEVWSPMTNGEDEADQLPLVGGEGTVTRCHWPAEEGQRVLVLEEHRAEPVRGGVALDDERHVEVR